VKRHLTLALTLVMMALAVGVSRAQERLDYVPLRVQVVIARYQGDKKLSSMPYTLSVNASPNSSPGTANLRMGAKIPVAMTAFTPIKVEGKEAKDLPTGGTPVSYNYQDVGTNIDCFATAMDGGRFRLLLVVDDTSVYGDETVKKTTEPQTPSFRSFKATDQMILKDGQTQQFTAAVDKISGEVTRVEVTVTVVK